MSVLMTKVELEKLIEQVAEKTAEAVVAKIMRSEDKLLDRYEAAKALGVSIATLDRRTHSGVVPSVLIGRLRRYRLTALLHVGQSEAKQDS